jgi:transposase
MVREHAQEPERIIFETGPFSVWFYHLLQAERFPAISVDERRAKVTLDMAASRTDANDKRLGASGRRRL